MSDESQQQLHNKGGGQNQTEESKKGINWKIGVIIILALSTALWQIGDKLTGFWSDLFHCTSVYGFLFDGAFATHEMFKSNKKRTCIWSVFGISCVVVGLVYFITPREPEPKPILMLITSHNLESVLFLTNESLTSLKGDYLNERSPHVFLPVFSNETSLTLYFLVKNMSPVPAEYPEIIVGFPKIDAFRWAPGWQLDIPVGDKELLEKTTRLVWTSTKILQQFATETAGPILTPVSERVALGSTGFGVFVRGKNIPPKKYRFWLDIGNPAHDSRKTLEAQVIDGNKIVETNGLRLLPLN